MVDGQPDKPTVFVPDVSVVVVVGIQVAVITTSLNEDVQPGLEIVHRIVIAVFIFVGEKVPFGFVVLEKEPPPVPETTVQEPVPTAGVLAAKVAAVQTD